MVGITSKGLPYNPACAQRRVISKTKGAGLKARYPILATTILLTGFSSAQARGVSPYLPMQMSPQIERQIEKVLILAGKPVMRRPIAAATVLDALPRACEVDRTA